MHRKIAIVYNEPVADRHGKVGEEKAILAVLHGVDSVHQALEELGYEVVRVPLLPPVESARSTLKALDTDLVFNLFEGFASHPKTEATIANILSELGFTYTGCSGTALSLALDKARAKEVMKSHGINTPRYQLLGPNNLSQFQLTYPCIVKPVGEDASHGLSAESVVHDQESLKQQVAMVSQCFGGRALVEEFVEGREFNATVMGNNSDDAIVLPISEIVYSLPPTMPRILTYEAKWETDTIYFQSTSVVCPADVGTEDQAQLTQTAITVFKLLVKHGYARVDMRLDSEGRIQVLEANPNPDITPGSGASRQAVAASMSYAQFVEKIVSLALQRKNKVRTR